MQTALSIAQPSRGARRFVRHATPALLIAAIGAAFIGTRLSHSLAAAPCQSTDRATYRVIGGDTLTSIASRFGTDPTTLATYNRLANPSLIDVNQIICIPGAGPQAHQPVPLTGFGSSGNYYPPGQCTWWADQRYHQLHKMYVPWTTDSDAWQWTARAHDFHWVVNATPTVGDIIDLQPWVQGAYGAGHVAIVEQVLGNGNVLASNLNWAGIQDHPVTVEFAPGPGVTFIHA